MTEYRAFSVSGTDVSQLYWETDTPTPQLIELGGFKNVHALVRAAGVGRVEGLICKSCNGPILVTSRSGLKDLSSRRATKDRCVACAKRERDAAFADYKLYLYQLKVRQRELTSMPYRDYLVTPEWASTRTAALKRAGYKCQTCSAGGRLNVHHRTYERRGHEFASDLTVLCESCHSLFHQNRKLVSEPSQ